MHLSEAEKTALTADLMNLGEPTSIIRQMAENVKRNLTYGKMSIDAWISAGRIYTNEEINREVESRIRRRKAEFVASQNPTEEELYAEGLEDVTLWYLARRQEVLDRLRQKLHTRARKAKVAFHFLPIQAKIDLWQKAVARGTVADGDPHAITILPLLAGEMLGEFEEAIRNVSAISGSGPSGVPSPSVLGLQVACSLTTHAKAETVGGSAVS